MFCDKDRERWSLFILICKRLLWFHYGLCRTIAHISDEMINYTCIASPIIKVISSFYDIVYKHIHFNKRSTYLLFVISTIHHLSCNCVLFEYQKGLKKTSVLFKHAPNKALLRRLILNFSDNLAVVNLHSLRNR